MARRVRDHDWQATPLGPLAGWPPWLRTAVDIVLALPGPATILWGPSHVQIYNDAYIAIARDRHPGLLGLPAAEGWPEAWPLVAPLLAAAQDGRAMELSDVTVMLRDPVAGVRACVFDTAWSPLRDGAGAVAGALQTLVERTDRSSTEAARRESEARLRAAFASVPAGIAVIDLVGATTLANDAYRRFLPNGLIPSRDPRRGNRWRAWDHEGALIGPEDYPGSRALRGEPVVPGQEMLFTDDAGREIWTRVGTVPILSAEGRVTGVISVISDIDNLKRAGDALRDSETRFQQFASSSSDALWIRDAATLSMEYASPAIRAIYGVDPETLLGDVRSWVALVVPEDRATALAHL